MGGKNKTLLSNVDVGSIKEFQGKYEGYDNTKAPEIYDFLNQVYDNNASLPPLKNKGNTKCKFKSM